MKKILFFLLLLGAFQFSHGGESTHDKYVGIYTWQGAARFRTYLQVSTGKLMISISEVGVFELIDNGEDTFKIKGLGENDEHQIVFETKDGAATGITWNLTDGRTFGGKRIKKLNKYAIDVDSQLDQKLETDRFEIWFSPQDTTEAREIFKSFKANYDSICQTFKVDDLAKLTVKIYPNKLHYAIGINLPDRMSSILTATEFGPEMIMMVSPRTLLNTPYYEMTISKGVLHEFVHVIHKNFSNNAFNTGWLYEGVAIYATKCCHAYKPQDIKYFRKKKHLSFDRINADMMFKKKYEAGPYIVEFIDQVYGWEKVISMMKEDANVEKVLGKSQQEVETEFYSYLEKTYF